MVLNVFSFRIAWKWRKSKTSNLTCHFLPPPVTPRAHIAFPLNWRVKCREPLPSRLMTTTYVMSAVEDRGRLGGDLGWPGLTRDTAVTFFDIFANISVPNRSKITKPRCLDSLHHPSGHKSEPASWVVSILINVENKSTYRSIRSLFVIEECHFIPACVDRHGYKG